MTIGARTNAIYREVVSTALDLKIDAIARAGDRLQDRRLARALGGELGVLRELRRLRGLEGLRSWRVVVSPGPAHWLASHAPFVRPDRIVTDLEELVAELPEAVAGLRLPGTEKPLRPPSELERDAGAERRVR